MSEDKSAIGDVLGVRVVATTLTDLHAQPSFLSEMLTQVTNGVELDVLSEEGEWCYVRQRDGYLGWAYAPYLAAVPAVRLPATHLVSSTAALAYGRSQETADPPIARLPIGTAVAAARQNGDWSWVDPVGGMVHGGWVQTSSLRALATLPLAEAEARRQVVFDARRLTGVYYLWGGNTAWGIDCSGLTQLCHRLAGYTLPRDARLQFPAGREVNPPFQPGDLLFFHGETSRDKITHVGISTGGWRMIHSSRARNGVYEEDLDAPALAKVRERFAGARSFLTPA